MIPRIVQAVSALADHPFPSGVRKLRGSQSTYRLRVGECRVVYEVFEKGRVITIIRVRHRKDAYR